MDIQKAIDKLETHLTNLENLDISKLNASDRKEFDLDLDDVIKRMENLLAK